MRAESRVVEVEKQCSMLEFDLKQSVQKMEQLMKQKERLEDEVREWLAHVSFDVMYFACAVPTVLVYIPSVGEESTDTVRPGVKQACPSSE